MRPRDRPDEVLSLSLSGVRGLGEAAVMAPIDYTRLVFAVLAGLLLFHEIPKPATLIGAVIVVGSTLFISWREHQVSRRAAALTVQAPE